MASGPIISWQIDGKTMETVTDYFWGLCKITADIYRSHEIKRRLLLIRKAMLMRWMKLEPIIQSEVSQKEKHQYSILTHIYGI